MKILVEDIPTDGTAVRAGLETGWAADAASAALDAAPQTLAVDLVVHRDGERLKVVGDLTVDVPRTCDRCLEAVLLRLEGEVELIYLPPEASGDAAHSERRLDEEELDLSWFDGRALDMSDVVSEQLALWAPDRIVCEDPAVTRLAAGECAPPDYDPGPDVRRASPFAGLAGLKLPK